MVERGPDCSQVHTPFGAELIQSLLEPTGYGALFGGEGLAGTEEAGDGAGPAEGETGESGIVLGVKGGRSWSGRHAGEKHAQDAAKGHTGDGNVGIEGGVSGVGGRSARSSGRRTLA